MSLANLNQRTSPLHDALDELHPTWIDVGGMPAPADLGHASPERVCARHLGVCDFSAFPRMQVKGPGAESWLAAQNLPALDRTYAYATLPGGGLFLRTGKSEFFVEDGLRTRTVARLLSAAPVAGCRAWPRQDASIAICGERANEVLLQTCGYEFRAGSKEFVMTRVAGVSCAVLPREFETLSCYQLWLDGTYGDYLWETLAGVVRELGGNIVGLGAFFPEIAERNERPGGGD